MDLNSWSAHDITLIVDSQTWLSMNEIQKLKHINHTYHNIFGSHPPYTTHFTVVILHYQVENVCLNHSGIFMNKMLMYCMAAKLKNIIHLQKYIGLCIGHSNISVYQEGLLFQNKYFK